MAVSSWISALLGGAGVAAAYQYKETGQLPQVLELVVPPGSFPPKGGADSSSAMVGTLSRDVEELKRMLQQQYRGQTPVAIVHHRDGGQGGWSVYMLTGCGLAAYLAYLRFYKGVRLGDLLYVTKASLNQSVTEVKQGLEGMQSRLSSTRKFIQQQLDFMSSRQEQGLKAQEELQGQLGQVGEEVENARGDVQKVQTSLEALGESVETTNQGVYVLCGVMAELIKRSGYRSTTFERLQAYIRGQVPPGGAVEELQAGEGVPLLTEEGRQGDRQRSQDSWRG